MKQTMKKMMLVLALTMALTTILMGNVPGVAAGAGDGWVYSINAEANGYATLTGSNSSAYIYARVKGRGTTYLNAGEATIQVARPGWAGGMGFLTPIIAKNCFFTPGSNWCQSYGTLSGYNLGQNYIDVRVHVISYADVLAWSGAGGPPPGMVMCTVDQYTGQNNCDLNKSYYTKQFRVYR
jgi:hypothetical protein